MLTRRSLLKIIIESIVGLVFTVLVLVFANIVNAMVSSHNLDQIVSFMNQYFYLVLISWFLGSVAKMIAAFIFPINIGAPAIHAVNSIICVYIGVKFIALLGDMLDSRFLKDFASSSWIILLYIFVFFVVLLFNFLDVVLDLKTDKSHKKWDKLCQDIKEDDQNNEEKESSTDGKSSTKDKDGKKDAKKFKKAVKNAAEAFKKTMEEE